MVTKKLQTDMKYIWNLFHVHYYLFVNEKWTLISLSLETCHHTMCEEAWNNLHRFIWLNIEVKTDMFDDTDKSPLTALVLMQTYSVLYNENSSQKSVVKFPVPIPLSAII